MPEIHSNAQRHRSGDPNVKLATRAGAALVGGTTSLEISRAFPTTAKEIPLMNFKSLVITILVAFVIVFATTPAFMTLRTVRGIALLNSSVVTSARRAHEPMSNFAGPNATSPH